MKNFLATIVAAGFVLVTVDASQAGHRRHRAHHAHSRAVVAEAPSAWSWFGVQVPTEKAGKSRRGRAVAAPTGDASGFTVQHARVSVSGLDSTVTAALSSVGSHFGVQPVVTSGSGGRGHARHSQHIGGHAADFRVPGVSKAAVVAYLKSLSGVGGVGTYGRNSIIHVDSGAPREWRCAGGGRYRRSSCHFAMR